MRGTRIIALAVSAALVVCGLQAVAASASKPGASEYELCVKRVPKKLRYKGQPANVRTGCHARMFVFSATHMWEVEGEPGWSGSYVVGTGEVFVFSADNDPLCALVGGRSTHGYGGEISLNESTQPGKIVCVEQAETWYTKEVGS
jgi:hypothetical protein